MKNLKYIILVVLIYSKIHAFEMIKTDFWAARKPQELSLKISPVYQNLAKECSEHYIKIVSFLPNFDKSDLKFYNAIPLKQDLTTNFRAVFKISDIKYIDYKSEDLTIVPQMQLNKNLEVEIDNLDKNSLSALTNKLGESLQKPIFERFVNGSDEIFLVFQTRDVACDFILNKIELLVQAPVLYKLSDLDLVKLETFYNKVSRVTTEILSNNESEYVKAAQLGLAYSKIQNTSETASSDYLSYYFNLLFKHNSLKLNSNWHRSQEGEYLIKVKSETGPLVEKIKLEL
jgi:hypothetical protein